MATTPCVRRIDATLGHARFPGSHHSALVTICTEAPNQFALARTLALSAFSTTEHQQAIRCRAARLTRGELRRTGGRFGAKHGVRRKSAFQRPLLAQGDPSRS